MSRSTMAADRVAALVLGLLALATGVLAIIWWSDAWSALSGQTDTAPVTDVLEQPWWPWALAAAGVLLVLIGARWLFAHLRSQRVGRLTLPGSTREGRLVAEAGSVARAAGEALGNVHGVRSSRASITHERGQLVARLNATVESDADLRAVAAGADRVSAELRQVLDRDDLYCRVQIKVSSRSSSLARVV